MANYIALIRFTQQGVAGISKSPDRASAFTAAAKKQGVDVVFVYWTMGSYDGVLIFRAPDDESATAVMLQLGAAGNVHTETLRAFDAAEMSRIADKVSGKRAKGK